MTQHTDAWLEWDKDKLEKFKVAYEESIIFAHDPVNDVFTFEGNIFVISYAKYLIEYLEQTLLK